MTVHASIVITTRNRKEELRRALYSAFAQDVPVEVLVMDDASNDGTAQMVEAEFSQARLFHSEMRLGYIVQRNRAAREAVAPFLFSIDDDAEFGSTDTVRRTLADFSDSRIGAVAIPHVDTLTNHVVNAPPPDDGEVWCVASYIGTAHAVRREVFLSLGGYCEKLVHQGEESDFCIRLLAAGFITRLGRAPLLLHHESPRRSIERIYFHRRRNDLLFAWRHTPTVRLPLHLAGTTLHGLRDTWKSGRWLSHCRGFLAGWCRIASAQARRQAVSPSVYRLHRRLKKAGPLRLSEIAVQLPSLVQPAAASVCG